MALRLSSLIYLTAETIDLAIRLSFSLILADDAYDLLRIRLQLSCVRLLSLRKQRHRRTKEKPND